MDKFSKRNKISRATVVVRRHFGCYFVNVHHEKNENLAHFFVPKKVFPCRGRPRQSPRHMDSGEVLRNATDTFNLKKVLHVGRSLAGMSSKAPVVQDMSYDARTIIVCYSPTMTTTNGIWTGDRMLDYSLPLFILQAIMIIVITRTLYIVIRRFRQPRFVAEVIVSPQNDALFLFNSFSDIDSGGD